MAGFSLIEVAMAMGVVAFGLLAIIGVMPVGLNTIQDSMAQEARASITAQLRGKLQQVSLTQTSGDMSLASLVGSTLYYTQEGLPTTLSSVDSPAYYVVTFGSQAVSMKGSDAEASLLPASAQSITVKMSCPPNVPSPRTTRLTLLVARQRN